MPHNQLIIDRARELYIKHGGTDHRAIELEMRAGGCLSFTRRVLHSQKTRTGRIRKGWIERFGWKDELKQVGEAETRVSTSVFYHPCAAEHPEHTPTAETLESREEEERMVRPHSDETSPSPSVGNARAKEKPSFPPRLGVSAVKSSPPYEGGVDPDPPTVTQAETRALASVLYHPLDNGEPRIENENPTSDILNSQLSTIHCPLGRLPGEALCPERFSKEDLERIKRKLGSYSFSALYQQRPTPPEGGLFKRQWFKRIVDKPPENLRWARGYDLAVSTKDSADFTASFRCAFDKKTGDLYIADGFRKRMEFPEQKRFITEKLRTERNTEHGLEHALHAQAFVQELRRQPGLITRPIRLVRPSGDKFTRALSWANLAEEGKVVLVRGSVRNGSGLGSQAGHLGWGGGSTNPAFRQPNWIEAFLTEICTFPNAAHDDQLDAVSTAVQMLERRKYAAYGF